MTTTEATESRNPVEAMELCIASLCRKQTEATVSSYNAAAYGALAFAIFFAKPSVDMGMNMYIETYGINMSFIAVTQMCVRTIDLILGFILAPISDSCNCMFGGRKNLILLGLPSFSLGLWWFSHPSSSSDSGSSHDYICKAMQDNCTSLRACIAESLSLEPAVDQSQKSLESRKEHHECDVDSISQLKVWMLLTYTLVYVFGISVITVSYDALGQDIASRDVTARGMVFAYKAVFGYFGHLCAISTTVWLSTTHPSSLSVQTSEAGKYASAFAVVTAFAVAGFGSR